MLIRLIDIGELQLAGFAYEVGFPADFVISDAEAAFRKAVTNPENSAHATEVTAFRASDSVAEFDYIAVGYPPATYRVRFQY